MKLSSLLTSLLAALLLAGGAHAGAPPEDDLYLKAMQSIAEGRQQDASQIVEQMIGLGPRHAGEWLDLALIQCALGHSGEAETLFSEIETRFTPPQGIRDIIAQQRAQGCQPWKAQSQWALTLTRGSDSNVNQGANASSFAGSGGNFELPADYLPQSDRYTALSGEYLRDLGQNGDLGFLQLHARQYQRLSHYNTVSLFAGAEHGWRQGRWRLRGSLLGGLQTLGGKLYQEQFQLQLRASPPLPLPEPFDLSLLGGLSYNSYKTLSNFDATLLELRSVLGYRSAPAQAQLSAGYLNDRGNGSRPGGARNGWSARLFVHAELPARLQGELDWSRQYWNGHAPYSPGLIELERQQYTRSLRATLSYPVARGHALQLEWRQVHNQENISLFQYQSRQLQLSWRWFGP
ncbi:tetratricopeptide repeat protein [Oxalobacteraceae bacterium]|nr:tetratricopeptide repeat protein [Oxalobacteraceae bacterium]